MRKLVLASSLLIATSTYSSTADNHNKNKQYTTSICAFIITTLLSPYDYEHEYKKGLTRQTKLTRCTSKSN